MVSILLAWLDSQSTFHPDGDGGITSLCCMSSSIQHWSYTVIARRYVVICIEDEKDDRLLLLASMVDEEKRRKTRRDGRRIHQIKEEEENSILVQLHAIGRSTVIDIRITSWRYVLYFSGKLSILLSLVCSVKTYLLC